MKYIQKHNSAFFIVIMLSSMLVSSVHAEVENVFTPAPVFNPKKPNLPATTNVSKFQRIATVMKKNAGERSIIIGGQKYFYGINTKVHTSESAFSSIQALTEGLKVGVNYTVADNGQRLLYKVWVFPADAKIASPSDS